MLRDPNEIPKDSVQVDVQGHQVSRAWEENNVTTFDGTQVVLFIWGWAKTLVPLVNIKIAGKWMFIPLKMVCIGIDP